MKAASLAIARRRHGHAHGDLLEEQGTVHLRARVRDTHTQTHTRAPPRAGQPRTQQEYRPACADRANFEAQAFCT